MIEKERTSKVTVVHRWVAVLRGHVKVRDNVGDIEVLVESDRILVNKGLDNGVARATVDVD